ncbi:MAG: DUF885 domain-containing protein [Candidatus Dormibacteria bacterium]
MSQSRVPTAFAELVDTFIDERCGLDPVTASFLGRREWDAELADLSAAGWRHHDERNRHWLGVFAEVDPGGLTAEEGIDRDLLLARLGLETATSDFENWRRAPEIYTRDGVFELFVHGAREEPEAVDSAITRLARLPETVAHAKANLSGDHAHPALLARDLGTVRGSAEFLRRGLGAFVSDAALRRRLEEAAAPAAAAYDDLAAHVAGLAGNAHGGFAWGQRRYDTLLRVGEQLSLTTHTLRELGEREYTAVATAMAEVARRISGAPDWRPVLRTLQGRHARDMPALLAEYRAATARAQAYVADRELMTMPAGERCAVEPAPAFLRAAVAVASYFPSAPFVPGSRGTFNVPYTPDEAAAQEVADRLETNAHYEIPSTTAHEAYPGHHAHFVRMASANPLRQFLVSDYFAEGWGLYVEKMMGEQGFYANDEELLGQLAARLMRAGRVVVDTSLHLGEMSIDEAATFMRERVGLPPAVARSEAERYAFLPGQASSYLTGAIAIEQYRDRWLAEGRGTLGEFHDAITASGSLPLGLAARAIGLEPAPIPPSQ